MTDDVLDADVRALLDLGRDQLAPDPETVARLRGRIEKTVAVAGAGIGVAGLVKGIGAKAIAVKLAVVAAIGVTTVAAVHVVRQTRVAAVTAPAVAPVPRGEVHEIVQPRIAPDREPAPEPAPAPAPEPEPVSASASPPVSASPSAPATAMHVPRRSLPRSAPQATLARETELVDLAARALRSGDLTAVHDAITKYTQETGGAGQLAEDIGAIEVEALCRANDPSAPHKLAAFAARWPHAGQQRRLVAACQGGQ